MLSLAITSQDDTKKLSMSRSSTQSETASPSVSGKLSQSQLLVAPVKSLDKYDKVSPSTITSQGGSDILERVRREVLTPERLNDPEKRVSPRLAISINSSDPSTKISVIVSL